MESPYLGRGLSQNGGAQCDNWVKIGSGCGRDLGMKNEKGTKNAIFRVLFFMENRQKRGFVLAKLYNRS